MPNSLLLVVLFVVVAVNFAVAADSSVAQNKQAKINLSQFDNGKTIIMTTASQQLAGIKTQPVHSAPQTSEFVAYGTVVNLEPLIQLRQQYLAARTQQNSAHAKYTEAQQNLIRTQNLHQQDIVSTRRLQEQQAQSQADKANLNSSELRQQTILATSRLEWGDILTDWFVLQQQHQAKVFLEHSAQLVLLSLPNNQQLPNTVQHILIDEHGQRQNAIPASLIASSPQIDPISQGLRYFFKATGRNLPSGSHITAWINDDPQQQSTMIIPNSALVWHLGQAFVFKQVPETQFNRCNIKKYTNTEQGYLVVADQVDDLKPGDKIVTTGAQTLLSEQLKTLIPNEDND